MKKKILSLFLSVFTLLSIFTPMVSFANYGPSDDHPTTIKLKNIYIGIPYEKSEITIDRLENNEEVKVIVKDKKTGKLLSSYGELKAKKPLYSNNKMMLRSGDHWTTTIYEEVTIGDNDEIRAKLYTELEMSGDSHFGQIERVVKTIWREDYSGNWKLTDDTSYSISKSGEWPTLEIETRGDATVVVETTDTVEGGFSVEFLEGFGFDIRKSSTGKYFARKNISCAYTYEVQPNYRD